MISSLGRVTGRIGPGLVGEVMVQVRGGSEAFIAYVVAAGRREDGIAQPTGNGVIPQTSHVEIK